MKIIVGIVIGLFVLSCSQPRKIQQIEQSTAGPGRNVVKIQAISKDDIQNLGSGVVIAPNKIATNCHVTRNARRIFVIEPDRRYPVLAQAALPEFDICILKTEHLALSIATLAESESVNIGDDIVVSGYPLALGLRMKQGKVIGLHPYGEDRIIEINTGFNHGASGGGVFDNSGKLIGLMTFMGPEFGTFHFYVIPANWLAMALEEEFLPLRPFSVRSFWENGEFVRQLKQ